MITAKGGLTIKRTPRKPKPSIREVERKLRIDNLRTAVEYYGKDYLRKLFKVTKRKVTLN